jgi:hypothetical protein
MIFPTDESVGIKVESDSNNFQEYDIRVELLIGKEVDAEQTRFVPTQASRLEPK